MALPNQTISSILKHDRKVNSYKIALVRAINDVVLNFPDLATADQDVAVPLKMLAELWLAYYWPFANPDASIFQGTVSFRTGVPRNDFTFRPDNRRPLTWERNQVDLLLQEGKVFHCPWTQKRIVLGTDYALDHLLPVSVYPINEIWNLVPSDPWFNSHDKRDRLPTLACLYQAEPHLVSAHAHYCTSAILCPAFREDTGLRFVAAAPAVLNLPVIVAHAVIELLDQFADLRSLARFSSCR